MQHITEIATVHPLGPELMEFLSIGLWNIVECFLPTPLTGSRTAFFNGSWWSPMLFSAVVKHLQEDQWGGLVTNRFEIMLAREWQRADIYPSRKSDHKWNRTSDCTTLDHHCVNFLANICILCELVFVLSKLMVSLTSRHKWYLPFVMLFKCLLWNPPTQAKNKASKDVFMRWDVNQRTHLLIITSTSGQKFACCLNRYTSYQKQVSFTSHHCACSVLHCFKCQHLWQIPLVFAVTFRALSIFINWSKNVCGINLK